MVSTFSTKWEVTSVADNLFKAWRDKWESLSFILCLPGTENYARHFKWSSLILVKIQRLCICIHIIQMRKQVKKANSLSQDHIANNGRSGALEPGLSDSRAWSLWKGSLGEGKKRSPSRLRSCRCSCAVSWSSPAGWLLLSVTRVNIKEEPSHMGKKGLWNRSGPEIWILGPWGQ